MVDIEWALQASSLIANILKVHDRSTEYPRVSALEIANLVKQKGHRMVD